RHDGATGDDHHRHPEGGHADDRGLTRDQVEVAGPEELRPHQQAEDRGHEDEADERADLLEEVRGPHAAPAAVAAMTSACSSHSAAGRPGPSVPRDMTAIRSHSPSSSPKSLLTSRTAFARRPASEA